MSLGKKLLGQLMYGIHQIIVPYTKQQVDIPTAKTLLGDPYTEITPTDEASSEVKVYEIPDLSTYWLGPIGSTEHIEFPNVLTSLSVVYENGGGATDYIEVGTSSESGNASCGMSVAGQCAASAYCIPKVVPIIQETWGRNVPVNHYYYFGQALDIATVLGKLSAEIGTTVNAWPVFKPVSTKMTLVGTRVNATGRTSFQGTAASHASGSSATETNGFGGGQDYAPTIEVLQIPPTLHAAITGITGSSSETQSATTSVAVTGAISGGGAGSADAVATGSVTPTSIAATSPTALPTTGLYAYKIEVEPSETFGYYFVHVIVFNFASVA